MNLAAAISQAHSANEARLGAQVAPYQMEDESKRTIGTFIRWCADNGVRACPATPATVALFVRSMGAEISTALLSSIAESHDAANLANPVATAAVRLELSRALKITPPRSWNKHEKLLFGALPIDIQAAIERRERERDIQLSRLQVKIAEFKKRHGGGEESAIETKEITDGKAS
jgi:hypothetical protein